MAILSPESNLLLKIQQRILANVPEIRWIDLDLGQLENDSIRPPVAFPCTLLQVSGVTYKDMQGNQQLATATVQIKIGFDSVSQMSNGTPLAYQEDALTHYEIARKVALWLNNWIADGILCKDFTRVSQANENREIGLRVSTIQFVCQWIDDGQPNQGNATVSKLGYLATGAEGAVITLEGLKNVEIVWCDRSDSWWGTATAGVPSLEPRLAIHDNVAGTLTFSNNLGQGEAINMLLKGL